MNLLYDFFQTHFCSFANDLEDLPDDDDVEEDCSDYVYVDGEEGDHGTIKFVQKSTGQLLAKKVILGGDQEYYEFTPLGRTYYAERLLQQFSQHLDKIKAQT